jgi:cellobiose-specific phosphotransferase system component IIC
MTVTTISLDAYEHAERELARVDARHGVTVHAIITAIVSVALIAINVFLAPAFPWSAFAVAGMVAGLAFHYYFGFLRVDDNVLEHQHAVERRMDRLA